MSRLPRIIRIQAAVRETRECESEDKDRECRAIRLRYRVELDDDWEALGAFPFGADQVGNYPGDEGYWGPLQASSPDQQGDAAILDEDVIDIDPPNLYGPAVDPTSDEILADRQLTSPDLRHQVERVILRLLSRGEAETEAIATELGMSVRTLSRRLGEARTTFAKILDELRHDMALKYLRDACLQALDQDHSGRVADQATS